MVFQNLVLRYVYITNNVTNESQLDAYLNQKATTYKKVETGTAKQWIQYSFTMSDEEYVELINRNNNLRIYSKISFQETDFNKTEIGLASKAFEETIVRQGTKKINLISSTESAQNFIYMKILNYTTNSNFVNLRSFFEIKEEDSFTSNIIYEGYHIPSSLNAKDIYLNNYLCGMGKELNLYIFNADVVDLIHKGYVIYYSINRA